MLGIAPRKTTALSPARQALGDAIENLREQEREVAASAEASRKATAAYWSAVTARDAARKALDDAPAAVVAHLTATAFGEAGETPVSTAQARTALAQAEELVATNKEVVEAVKARARQEGIAGYTADRVQAAAAAVIRESPEYLALLEETEDLQRLMLDNLAALATLKAAGVIGSDREAWQTRAYAIYHRAERAPTDWRELLEHLPRNKAMIWQATLAALKTDATAPLPAAK